MVEKGEEADVIKMLHESMGMFSVFSHLTWAMSLLTRIPAGAKALTDHIKWTQSVLLKRKKVCTRVCRSSGIRLTLAD